MPMKFKRAAVIAAAAMLFASCGGTAEPAAPEPVEPGAPSLDGLQPVDVDDTDAEPEPDQVEPEPVDEHLVELEPEPDPEASVTTAAPPEPEPEPVPEPFDEEIEDFDPAEHVLVEPSTDPDAHPCDRIDDSDDGAAGVCTVDGQRFCYSEAGWGDCPGGDTAVDGSCPAVEPGDPFTFTGTGGLYNEEPPRVLMEEGSWRIDACVRNNDLTTGEPSRFTVSLFTPPNDEGTGKGGVLFDVEAVVNSEWTTEIDLVWGQYEPLPFEVLVTPVGGGTWTVHITAVEGYRSPGRGDFDAPLGRAPGPVMTAPANRLAERGVAWRPLFVYSGRRSPFPLNHDDNPARTSHRHRCGRDSDGAAGHNSGGRNDHRRRERRSVTGHRSLVAAAGRG